MQCRDNYHIYSRDLMIWAQKWQACCLCSREVHHSALQLHQQSVSSHWLS